MDPRLLSVQRADSITSLFEAEYSQLCRLAFLLTGDESRAEEVACDSRGYCLPIEFDYLAWRITRSTGLPT